MEYLIGIFDWRITTRHVKIRINFEPKTFFRAETEALLPKEISGPGMVQYINGGRSDALMPGYIPAVSPGNCVETEEEWQRMPEPDKPDVAIPARYMKTAVGIMCHGDDTVPDYMLWLQKGNFRSCPHAAFM